MTEKSQLKAWDARHMRKDREVGLFCFQKRRLREEVIIMFQYLKSSYKEERDFFNKESHGIGNSNWTDDESFCSKNNWTL